MTVKRFTQSTIYLASGGGADEHLSICKNGVCPFIAANAASICKVDR